MQLDRLGGVAWQSRKARLKKRIREIADELIKIAALRAAAPSAGARRRRTAPTTSSSRASLTRRPRTRTASIDAVLDDLASRQADGPAGLRRRRLRQDRSGAAGRLRCRDGRQAGRRRGADDAARAPALQDLHRALPGAAGEDRAGLAPGRRQGARRGQGRASSPATSTSSSAPTRCSARRIEFARSRPADRRRGAALRRRSTRSA